MVTPRHGFTLVEMVVAITLLALAVPMFQWPLRAYFDSQARGEVASEIELVTTQMRADFARAVPGSVRVRTVGTRSFVEFLRYRAQGRYRSATGTATACPAACAGANPDVMQFASATKNCFATVGPLDATGGTPVANSDFIAIPASGDLYQGGNANGPSKSRYQQMQPAVPPANAPVCLRMQANSFAAPPAQAALEQVRRNFYVVETPVVYECNATTGQLLRRWGHPITAGAVPLAFGAAPSALVATTISTDPTNGGCSFLMQPTPAGSLRQLVRLTLRFEAQTPGGNAPERVEAHLEFAVQEAP
jgi:MSHA biogenesis protein MshO